MVMELIKKYLNNRKVSFGILHVHHFVSQRLSKADANENYRKIKEFLHENIGQFVQRIDHNFKCPTLINITRSFILKKEVIELRMPLCASMPQSSSQTTQGYQ